MAATTSVGSIKRHFRTLQDPRVTGRSRHLLVDIIVVGICGVIANCDDWPDIELFAKHRLGWFKRFLRLPHGVPSHDTLERVFGKLDPRGFESLVKWTGLATVLFAAAFLVIGIVEVSLARASANGTLAVGNVVLASMTKTTVRVNLLPQAMLAAIVAAALTWSVMRLSRRVRKS